MNIIEAEIGFQQKRLGEARANRERYEIEVARQQQNVEFWNNEAMKAAIVVDLLLEEQKRQKKEIA